MKRELNHHYIGESYGGNQDWFRTFWMRIGGCGAETACESSLYFARELGFTKLYPFDSDVVKREEYVDFAHMMEDYLWPRIFGRSYLRGGGGKGEGADRCRATDSVPYT